MNIADFKRAADAFRAEMQAHWLLKDFAEASSSSPDPIRVPVLPKL